MNVGKSLKIILAKRGKSVTWLSEQLDCSLGQASNLCNKKGCSRSTLEKLSAIFGMKISQIIAEGEEE